MALALPVSGQLRDVDGRDPFARELGAPNLSRSGKSYERSEKRPSIGLGAQAVREMSQFKPLLTKNCQSKQLRNSLHRFDGSATGPWFERVCDRVLIG